MNRKSPEFLERRNILSLILFHIVFFLLDLFVILQPHFPAGTPQNKTFLITAGAIFGASILGTIITAFLYKNQTMIHFKKCYDKANRILTYTYIGLFGVYLIMQFLQKSGKVTTNISNIVTYVIGAFLTLLSLSAISLNTYIIIKEKTDIPLSDYLAKQNEEENKEVITDKEEVTSKENQD